jgi:hypothetical protein
MGKLCQPETIMGPIVYVVVRLHPVIRRDSADYKRLRSGVERSNSQRSYIS